LENSSVVRPESYRRLLLLPVWLSGSAQADESLTLVDLRELNHVVGSNLTFALMEVFVDKGYHPASSGQPLCGDDEWDKLAPAVRPLLEDTQAEFQELSDQLLYRSQGKSRRKAVQYRWKSDLAQLCGKLRIEETGAVVLVDTRVHFESPIARKKRVHWNITVGVPLTVLGAATWFGGGNVDVPYESSPCLTELAVAVVDPRTQELVWLNARAFPSRDARKTSDLRGSVRELLADLPQNKNPEPERPSTATGQKE
jgi:hypothetical protein